MHLYIKITHNTVAQRLSLLYKVTCAPLSRLNPLLKRNSYTMYFIKQKYCSTVLSTACFIYYMMKLNTHSSDMIVSGHIDSGRITTVYLCPTLVHRRGFVRFPSSAQEA